MKTGSEKNDIEVILRTDDPDLSWTWSFILTALQIPHRIREEKDGYSLLVPTQYKTYAIQEIDGYFREISAAQQLTTSAESTEKRFHPPTVLLVSSLALFYPITGPWAGQSAWFQSGAGNAQEILQNSQWFRLVTSLTLHADFLHLMNNCLLGGFILHFVFLSAGTGLGLFAVLLAAVVGNYINVLLHGSDHLFVGFSTAVFAAIGILATFRTPAKSKSFGKSFRIPVMAGFALLAMLGSSGKQTDLGAHLFGLLSGMTTGKIMCLTIVQEIRDSQLLQSALFLVSLATVFLSWYLALMI